MIRYFQLTILALTVLSSGCIHSRITSRWSRATIAIDGDQSDWKGALKQIKGKEIAVGAMNDGTYLYVTLSSPSQRTLLQIMRGGLTVWIDLRGLKRKVVGIRYPLGIVTQGQQNGRRFRPDRGQRPDSAELLESMLASEQFVEISGPDKDDLAHVPLSSEEGIQVAIGMSDYGLLVYELRIPLVAIDGVPHAVGAAPGQTIGIGFETGSLTPPGGRRSGFSPAGGRGGGISVGGRGGRSGGGRRGGGFRTGGGRGPSLARTSQPLNHWVKVTLAKESQESAGG